MGACLWARVCQCVLVCKGLYVCLHVSGRVSVNVRLGVYVHVRTERGGGTFVRTCTRHALAV
jgi:hypothetical protein